MINLYKIAHEDLEFDDVKGNLDVLLDELLGVVDVLDGPGSL